MPIDRVETLLDSLAETELLTPAQVKECRAALADFPDTKALARHLLQRDWLTPYQVNHVFQDKAADLFLDNYVLLDRIGQGGMGQVFRARHRVMNRVVALKIIRRERLANADLVKRFHREIQMAAQVKHTNIVMSYDADRAGETHFLVMEFVEGTDLARFVEKNGPRPVAQACDWIRQAALGLQHAHEQGLVHRDIKPSNLLLSVKDNVVKVLDLGLARLSQGVDADLTAVGLTVEGTVMGTPDYMAPEQAEESTAVDTRADVYSLGCTLYFLLAGHAPFPGGTLAQKLRKHAQAEPPPLDKGRHDVPPGLIVVLHTMMAKRPEDRYQTPGEVAAALDPFGRTGPVPAVPVAAARPVAVPLVGEALAAAPHPVAVPVAVAVPAQAGETIPVSGLDSVPSVTHTWPPTPVARLRRAWRRLGRRGQIIAGAVAAVLLLGLVIAFARRPSRPEEAKEDQRTALERLDPKDIPPEDRPAWQARELKDVLVAVLGEHRVRLSSYVCLALRPDRAKVAIADGDAIRLVDTRTLRQEKEFTGHGSTVTALAFAADGKLLASGSRDRSLRLWDCDTGKPREFPGAHGEGGVSAVALTPDGTRVLSGGEDGEVHVWDAGSRKRLATFTGHTSPIRALAVSRDGKLAYSAGGPNQSGQPADRDVRVWDVASGKAVLAGGKPRLLGVPTGFVSRLELSADGKRLLAASNTPTVYVWDLAGADKPDGLKASPNGNLSDGTFVGEDRVATYGSGDGGLRLWVPNGRTLLDLDPIPRPLWPTASGLAWLAAVPRENRPGAETDSGILYVRDNTVHVWNLDRKKEWRPPLGHTRPVRQLAFTDDGEWLVSAGDDRTVRFWKFADLYDPASGWPKESRGAIEVPSANNNPLAGAGVSQDGKVAVTLVVGEKVVPIWVYDNNAWTAVRRLEPAMPSGSLTAVALSPNGLRALTAGTDKVLRLWDVKRGTELKKADELSNPASRLGFLPDDRAYSWHGNELRFWEGLAGGEKLRSVAATGVSGSALALAPERNLAVTGTGDGSLLRWTDLAGGKPVKQGLEHWQRGWIGALALSPDRKRLLAGDGDGRFALWDLGKDPVPKPQFYDLRGAASAAAFAPDGRHAAVANADGTIYILRLPP